MPPARKRTAGHVVAIVIGCLALLPGLGMLAGGGTLAIAQAVATDDDGYFTVTLDRLDSDGVAIATSDLWLEDADDDAAPWVFDFIDLDVRFRVEGAGPTDEVFVGIARAADVEDYLARTRHSELIGLDNRTPEYRERGGIESIASPLDDDIVGIWDASASGTGEQELTWEARGGRWAVVVMNADGEPGVAADVELGGRSGVITPIAVTLMVTGGLLTLGAIALIVIGARGRRTPGRPTSAESLPGAPFPPTAPAAPAPPAAPTAPVDTADQRSDDDSRQPAAVG